MRFKWAPDVSGNSAKREGGVVGQCKTCKYAEWQYGKGGGVRRNTHGTCKVEFKPPQLPLCIPEVRYHRVFIWMDMDGDCPTYNPKEK